MAAELMKHCVVHAAFVGLVTLPVILPPVAVAAWKGSRAWGAALFALLVIELLCLVGIGFPQTALTLQVLFVLPFGVGVACAGEARGLRAAVVDRDRQAPEQ